MNFITFPASATNIFPIANSHAGGQLVTEWNMRAREMVPTDPNVTYPIGPSFTHGESDFEVKSYTDSTGVLINAYTLEIEEGRAVINGHYVETLTPMIIDLQEANFNLIAQARPVLKGNLAIGIRTFYSSDQTVAGSILVENEEGMFLGVQLVVLPEEELLTPSDCPNDQSKVTADLRLATFTFLNNQISDIRNLKEKLQYLSPARVSNITDIISSRYVTKIGLNSKKLYAFAGKGTDPSTGKDTWEDVTDSMVVWDFLPQRTPIRPTIQEAQIVTVSDSAYFVLPHKQVEGMTTDGGDPEYYAPRIMELPIADYGSNTVGLVNRSYTNHIKDLTQQISDFKTFVNGKQIAFWDERAKDQALPPINQEWNPGDYLLVRVDKDYLEEEGATSPSTLYAILPGQVTSIHFVAQVDGDVDNPAELPSNILGVELGFLDWYEESGASRPDTEHPEYYPQFYGESDVVRGVPGDESSDIWVDYFRLRYYVQDSTTYAYTDYFYAVLTSGPKIWSDAVLVTGAMSLATLDRVGGFINSSEDATDYGYVRLDNDGHLVLTDYQLLRSGTLAYQIATDITIPEAEDYTETQAYLTEYVNNRVAFPSTLEHGVYCAVLHIYIPLFASADPISLEVSGIDSRFNTAVCLHITGTANSNVTLNIADCQKLIIDSNIEGTPVINVIRTCLYYDPAVFNYIRTCERGSSTFTGFQDLTIWYEKLNEESLSLVVNGMTVSELDAQIIAAGINYWKELGTAVNDNNYLVALKSITFSGTGDIVGCEVLTANNSTDNIFPGDKIVVGEFVLPQGSVLTYPVACLTRTLKVSGEFTSAYYSDGSWYVTNNSFSLATGTYSALSTDTMTGQVAFHSVTTLVPSTIAQTSISVWEPDSYHIFQGGAID